MCGISWRVFDMTGKPMDTSVFAYVSLPKPRQRGGYVLSTFRKGEPPEGFFDRWSAVGGGWYRCIKRYPAGLPPRIEMPEGTYENTQISDCPKTPYIQIGGEC
jgi:hypothetical protein